MSLLRCESCRVAVELPTDALPRCRSCRGALVPLRPDVVGFSDDEPTQRRVIRPGRQYDPEAQP